MPRMEQILMMKHYFRKDGLVGFFCITVISSCGSVGIRYVSSQQNVPIT